MYVFVCVHKIDNTIINHTQINGKNRRLLISVMINWKKWNYSKNVKSIEELTSQIVIDSTHVWFHLFINYN